MGSVLSYSGISTKIRAMSSHLVTDEQLQEIVRFSDVPQVAAYLKKTPEYAKAWSDLDENNLHRGEIEKLLKKSIFGNFSRIYNFANKEQRKFLALYSKRYEIRVLKEIMTNLFDHRSTDPVDMSPYRDFFLHHSKLDIDRVAGAGNMDEFMTALKGNEFYAPLQSVYENGNGLLFDYGMALDLYYFNQIWSVRKKLFKGNDLDEITKAYGEKLLFDDLNFMLPPNGIVGVIGPNGAGKTTLFRLIMGLETVDKGEFEVGETVKVAYVDQQHKDIDPNKTVYQVISGGNELIRMGGRDINARAYLSRFNFSGADQEKLCGMLSGGERNRLHLAIALKEEGNVLLLDEPTNDIDVNTLRALEEGLEDFAGCAVVISHDRWFLDRICTHILAFEGDSNVFYFEGSYSEYEENKMKRLGNEEPKRVRYRKLMND